MGLVYSVSVPLPVRNPLMLPELIGWSLGFQCLLCGAWGLGIILTLEFFAGVYCIPAIPHQERMSTSMRFL